MNSLSIYFSELEGGPRLKAKDIKVLYTMHKCNLQIFTSDTKKQTFLPLPNMHVAVF